MVAAGGGGTAALIAADLHTAHGQN